MIYYLAFNNLFGPTLSRLILYITVRAGFAFITSFILFLVLGHLFLKYVSPWVRAQAREYTPISHQNKNNTPTMGGVIIIQTIMLAVFLWADVIDKGVIIILLTLVLYGLLGLYDDCCKLMHVQGISARVKFFLQIFAALFVICLMVFWFGLEQSIIVPCLKKYDFYLGSFFLFWALFVMVAMSNAVNLTDGLDGLATSVLIPNFCMMGFVCYVASHIDFSYYLHIPLLYSSELTVVCAAIVGSLIGFLWFNAYPAQMWMGDVGSLSLGACLAAIALLTKQELLLPIMSAVMVFETVSVMIQVLWFRKYRTKFFNMAPLHHHFELQGIHESKVTVRFAIISSLFSLLALIFLKIR